MKKNTLLLQSYYLDFSFPNKFSPETRIFINIPLESKDSNLKILQICFELNSIYGKNNSPLKVMISSKFEIDESTNRKSYSKTFKFTNEKDLYLNIFHSIDKFLEEEYLQKWDKFYDNSKEKNIKKYKIIQKDVQPKCIIDNFKLDVKEQCYRILNSQEPIHRNELVTTNFADKSLEEEVLHDIKNIRLKSNYFLLADKIKDNQIKIINRVKI